jgi:hypothetical protein
MLCPENVVVYKQFILKTKSTGLRTLARWTVARRTDARRTLARATRVRNKQ